MAISQELALVNLMNTLDDFLASLRLSIDTLSTKCVIQRLNCLRCQIYGDSISIFEKGVLFGLKICQIKDLGDTWGLAYGPGGPSSSLIASDNKNDWVVTRGNLYDGSNIINIDTLTDRVYAYKLNPYLTAEMKNYLIPGVVFYSVSAGSFTTTLSGQTTTSHPIIGVEKTGINKAEFISKALDYKYFNQSFTFTYSSDYIMIGRFIIDVDDVDDYEITYLNDKDYYPFIYGQPYYSYMLFAGKIFDFIRDALVNNYDSNVVYDMMYYIINADVWGSGTTAFYDYWTAGGRSLPSNVKYYYNILFDPDIP